MNDVVVSERGPEVAAEETPFKPNPYTEILNRARVKSASVPAAGISLATDASASSIEPHSFGVSDPKKLLRTSGGSTPDGNSERGWTRLVLASITAALIGGIGIITRKKMSCEATDIEDGSALEKEPLLVVTEAKMPAKESFVEAKMPAKDPDRPKDSVAEAKMPAKESVAEIKMLAKDPDHPKESVAEVKMPAKENVAEVKMPAKDPDHLKKSVAEVKMPAKESVAEVKMPAKDRTISAPQLAMAAQFPSHPVTISGQVTSSTQGGSSTIEQEDNAVHDYKEAADAKRKWMRMVRKSRRERRQKRLHYLQRVQRMRLQRLKAARMQMERKMRADFGIGSDPMLEKRISQEKDDGMTPPRAFHGKDPHQVVSMMMRLLRIALQAFKRARERTR
jgi:hypothetical protein